ncbi:sigma 54-interacting transcriptional regulator [Rossellomorea aquimaris]|uniref:sigma-54 interaction domain-containing protein n=1 Tax=Rossellomorea aquimaris TaxID=189382 RepID=UPI001CD4CEE0|nr:sigma 54-interacting transcriptional regulator [Rossellomorea aquimaris]MCA1059661.1 sigma 54-interacting transcriptional regulator [Rossellomorea aquimaris]
MKHELILLAGTKETKKALKEQLQAVFGELIYITSYACDEGIPKYFTDSLIVYSSSLIAPEVQEYIDFDSCTIIQARRTVNYEYIDRIFELPPGKKILYVNDFIETAQEAVSTLKRLGIDHVEYVPYSPLRGYPGHIDTAISPGEMASIPSSIPNKIDIGVRLIDLNTIMNIISYFQLSEQLTIDITDRYTRKIIELSQKLGAINRHAKTLNKFLTKVVDGVNDGILAFQEDGEITVFNEVLERMLGITAVHAKGKKLNRVFKNIELNHFLTSHQDEDQKYFTLRQQNVMVYRFRLEAERVIVATFKDMEETLEMEKVRKRELQRRGYIAKYTFDSILGNSRHIIETKSIAGKLAQSELPILIYGETGTGKELFSSAIHNVSSRKHNPYLAVNCSALPEDLLESELFGYEDGAFTGAKKGGKTGLFEQADGGTLFLDEIGDISLKLQARLLRVLQEMEIRRIGGNKNIPVDVRIIAATNKDLQALIRKGTFREDLYHRLKVLSLQLPSLRERRTDIPLLIENFFLTEQSNITTIDDSVLEAMTKAPWSGNIRELKNTLLYMMTVAENNRLTINELPVNDHNFAEKEQTISNHSLPEITMSKSEEYINILSVLVTLYENGQRASRQKLHSSLGQSSTPLSVQQIRTRLKELQELGYIHIQRGRIGTEITPAGVKWYKNQKENVLTIR